MKRRLLDLVVLVVTASVIVAGYYYQRMNNKNVSISIDAEGRIADWVFGEPFYVDFEIKNVRNYPVFLSMAGFHIREDYVSCSDDGVVCHFDLTNLVTGDKESVLESKYYYRLERLDKLRGRVNLSDLTCRRLCGDDGVLEQGEGVSGQLWLQIVAEKDNTRGIFSSINWVLSEAIR